MDQSFGLVHFMWFLVQDTSRLHVRAAEGALGIFSPGDRSVVFRSFRSGPHVSFLSSSELVHVAIVV